MKVTIQQAVLELVQGDITEQQVDALVNAANQNLAGGGGVDGAIHRRGGPAIMTETRKKYPKGCPTGSAVITSGGRLAAKFVIHAVGPIYRGGVLDADFLRDAYQKSLELALANNCQSVALPAISTGVYGYPMAEASEIALATVIAFLKLHGRPELVRFVLFDESALAVFSETLERLTVQTP